MELEKWPQFDVEQISKVSSILTSGKVNYWTGIEGKSFENEFAHWLRLKYALTMSNGTVSLYTAYKFLNLKEGDEFITTPRSFIATASAGVLLGAKPVFADVCLDSGNITPESIEPLISKKTRLISIVHLGGWPADIIRISNLAKSYNIKLVEDCAQAHGAKFDGMNVGSFGKISSWSFCQDKIISTGGEGGMLATNDKDLFEKIRSYRDHGKNIKLLENKKQNSGFRYIHDDFGNNFRLSEMQSAIGRIQLRKLSTWNRLRTYNANLLLENLKDLDVLRIPRPKENITHAWYKFYVYLKPNYLDSSWTRERIIEEINLEGFPAYSGSCSEIYLEKSFQNKFNNNLILPNARTLGDNSLMFLVHPTISKKKMQRYAEVIKKVIKKATK